MPRSFNPRPLRLTDSSSKLPVPAAGRVDRVIRCVTEGEITTLAPRSHTTVLRGCCRHTSKNRSEEKWFEEIALCLAQPRALGNHYSFPLPSYTLNEVDVALHENMAGYWARFTAAGNPNRGDDAAFSWPPFKRPDGNGRGNDKYLILKSHIGAMCSSCARPGESRARLNGRARRPTCTRTNMKSIRSRSITLFTESSRTSFSPGPPTHSVLRRGTNALAPSRRSPRATERAEGGSAPGSTRPRDPRLRRHGTRLSVKPSPQES
jgi:hypothetical protein